MDFNELWENTKNTAASIWERIVDFFEENRRNAIIVAALIVVILVSLIVLICVSSQPKNKNGNLKPELILSEEMMVPEGPELHNEYKVSREPKDSWSDKEADEWFSVPSNKDVESLGKANDGLITEILGAAP
ncbi:MAG: hypothetical protein MJ162_03770 [Treponema sp.]|nr:hypothetical protein [Treponema sp.]